MVAKLGALLFSLRCPGRVFAADRYPAYRLCSTLPCGVPRYSMPSKPGSTLPKLGTCFMAGEMPGGKPCWFQVPSLSDLLPVRLGFLGILPKPKQPGCIFSKLGTQILPPKFPGARPTTDRVPSLEHVLSAWLMLMRRPQHTISYRFPTSLQSCRHQIISGIINRHTIM